MNRSLNLLFLEKIPFVYTLEYLKLHSGIDIWMKSGTSIIAVQLRAANTLAALWS